MLQYQLLKKAAKTELVLYQKVSIGTGKQAANPWLQELPDPITKATWDNYANDLYDESKRVVGIDLISVRKHIMITNIILKNLLLKLLCWQKSS